jgi:hypothetical protein
MPLQYPKIGYRKLTWMMIDAGVACVGESTVYRVLSDADLLSRWKRLTVSSDEYNFRPNGPNQPWHTDVMYVWVAARFYFLLTSPGMAWLIIDFAVFPMSGRHSLLARPFQGERRSSAYTQATPGLGAGIYSSREDRRIKDNWFVHHDGTLKVTFFPYR